MGHRTWLFEVAAGVRGAGGTGGAFCLHSRCLSGTYYVPRVMLGTGLKLVYQSLSLPVVQ